MALPEILLIDDNTHRSQQVEGILRFLEYRVEAVASSDFEAAFRDHDSFGAVFVGCGGDKQASLIKTVTESVGDIPVVLLVDAGGPQVVSAIQQMVNKTLEWPTVYPLLIQLLDSLPQPAQASKKSLPDKGLAGKSKAIQKTRAQIDQVAKSDATVLILGESGTGKEVWRKRCIVPLRGETGHSCRSIAGLFPVNCWKVNCSATRRVHLPAR